MLKCGSRTTHIAEIIQNIRSKVKKLPFHHHTTFDGLSLAVSIM